MQTKSRTAQRAADLMASSYHCSEAIFIAVGEEYVPELSEPMIKMSTPFAGGIGGTHQDLCGAFTGGLMVIGALHGRADLVNDDDCQKLAADFRFAFLERFGSLTCSDLRQGACGQLTKDAALLLMEMLDGFAGEKIYSPARWQGSKFFHHQ
jgi:C_GCAxxG_C_C family probable redox protein